MNNIKALENLFGKMCVYAKKFGTMPNKLFAFALRRAFRGVVLVDYSNYNIFRKI